jgi:hypothetical protein
MTMMMRCLGFVGFQETRKISYRSKSVNIFFEIFREKCVFLESLGAHRILIGFVKTLGFRVPSILRTPKNHILELSYILQPKNQPFL